MSHRLILSALAPFVAVTLANVCDGHFVWLKSVEHDGQVEAVLYFSEAPHSDGTRVPEKVQATKINVAYAGKVAEPVALELRTQQDQADMRGKINRQPCSITARCEYGVYQGFLLSYDAEHIRYENIADVHQLSHTTSHELDLVLTVANDNLVVQALLRGNPIAGIEIHVVDSAATQHQLTTDDDGKIEVRRISGGLVGIRAHYVDSEATGERDGVQFQGAHYYSTLTIEMPRHNSEQKTDATTLELPMAIPFATLPEPITSFGAAFSGGYIYVYGGHIGQAHHHSRDNLSTHFRRYNVETQVWEELPMERPLQGLALVSHGKWLYRIGGMEARNPHDQPADMHSTVECAKFDTETLRWERIPDLPDGRSSHDAVISNGQLYVIGGWNLAGESEGTWHDEPLVINLEAEPLQWRALPRLPSTRRALAVAELDGKLYAVGGINDAGEIDRSVDIFDVATESWKGGPTLPGEEMNSFGVSAWNHDGAIYVAGIDGVVQQLNAQTETWVAVGKMRQGRFFHRLASYPGYGLLAIGGASRKGHLADIELLPLVPPQR